MKDKEKLKQELMEAIGEEWVEDDPSVLTCYFRDISTIKSPRPGMVVMPGTTKDVQRLMLIAKKYKVPLVPLATGFNIAGLTLPRKKGIVVDLKRMDKILKVDTEAMTMTMQPYVRNAAAYAEANRFLAAEGLKLRVGNPITVGSASLFGNILSGGMSVNALSTGMHFDNIAGQTWVLPDGEILKLRCSLNPNVGNLGSVKGPGPDISGMFFNAEGQFGICTEMVINIFPDPEHSKMLFLRPRDLINYSFSDIISFISELSKEDFVSEIYKSGNITLSSFMGEVVEKVARGMPEDIVIVTVTGHTLEELEIKEKRVNELAVKNKLIFHEEAPMEYFLRAQGKSPQEFQDNIFKKCYHLGGIMRWRGCFNFVGCATTLDRVVELEGQFHDLIKKHFEPMGVSNTLKNRLAAVKIINDLFIEELKKEVGPEKVKSEILKLLPSIFKSWPILKAMASRKKWENCDVYPAHTAIQGPMPMGRGCWFELDMWYNPSDPVQVDQYRRFADDCTKMMLDLDLFIPRDFSNAFVHQFPLLGTYCDILINLKQMMDPDDIMNPKVMELYSKPQTIGWEVQDV